MEYSYTWQWILLSSFLSSHMNKRKDKWGGSTENRFRIVKEIILKARKIVGSFPILAKISAYEKSKDGMKIAEAIKISKYLEDVGCDAIEVSCGIVEDGFLSSRGDVPSIWHYGNFGSLENFKNTKFGTLPQIKN